MNDISPKVRLMDVLNKKKVDRAPVVCSGSMMNSGILDIMNETGNAMPYAHHNKNLMAKLSEDIYKYTGFENLSIPFCMTVEAECLGSEIDFGSLEKEAKVKNESALSVIDYKYNDINKLIKTGRIETVIQAGYNLSKKHSDIPIIGSITGPISTAASIIKPEMFFRDLKKYKNKSHELLDYISDFSIEYARQMIDNGVDCICIGDPSSAGEIIGAKCFNEYSIRYLNKIIDSIHKLNIPVIAHICGEIKHIRKFIIDLKSDAISTDALVNLKGLKEEYSSLTTMGNVSTYLIENGTSEKVQKKVEHLIKDGIDIISPACGLSNSKSINNIKVLTDTVKTAV